MALPSTTGTETDRRMSTGCRAASAPGRHRLKIVKGFVCGVTEHDALGVSSETMTITTARFGASCLDGESAGKPVSLFIVMQIKPITTACPKI